MTRGRRFLRAVLLAAIAVPLALSAVAGAAVKPKTTLDGTIIAIGERELAYGPAQEMVTRAELGWDDPGVVGTPLAGFKQLSDIHVVDEESPGRVEYYEACTANASGFASAYRPQEPFTTQVGDSMLRRLAKITEGPTTGANLKFVISTGDNIDNNQLNELRWFIRLLDGDVVKPNSGAKSYNGYRQQDYSQAMSDEILALAQKKFDAVGTKSPWYAVIGNHDGLVQGNVPLNDTFQDLVVGGLKAFPNIDNYDTENRCPESNSDPNAINIALAAFLSNGRGVPADENRRFLTHEEVVAEHFNTSGAPAGHGFARAPDDPFHGGTAGYYSFPISKKVRGIVMDTISYASSANGHLTDQQYLWLQDELKKWSTSYYDGDELVDNPEGKNKLIVLFSHHSSTSMNAPGADDEGAPYHCFEPDEAIQCGGAGLHDLFLDYPNIVAWVNGHEHNNKVRGYPAVGDDSSRAFWEINTAAHIDWPQQSRLIEIAWAPGAEADTVIIYGTVVDHSAPLVPNPDTQTTVKYLASLSRIESYYDACVRELQADCEAQGEPGDRNVKLIQKAPFDLGP